MRPEDVPGRITNEVGDALRRLARDVPANQVIVEIGAYLGKSTCFLGVGSLAGDGARVISIDAWDTPGNTPGPVYAPDMYVRPTNRSHYDRHLKECGVDGVVTTIQDFSWNVDLPSGTSIGLLWVDGAHDYAGVSRDVERFCPLLASGGHVVFDDYRVRCPGVDRKVNELRRDTKTWASWDLGVKTVAIGRKA